MKAAAYIRVSTHHQLDKDSLPFQRQELANYCRYVLNLEYELFEDAGYSAKNTDRPKYQEMISRIRRGEFTHLVVWKLDRISRNIRDFTELWEELKTLGVTFVSRMEQFDTSTAMGEAMLNITLVFAQLERKMTAERVMSIMLSRAEKGMWNGAPVPIGYDWDEGNECIAINESEAQTVRTIFNMYEKTNSSVEVAHHLTKSGTPTKRGGKWTTKTVRDVLRSPIYKGTLRYNYRSSARGKMKKPEDWIIIDDAVPAIVSREQWDRVQVLLDENRWGDVSHRKSAKRVHVFSGLIKCGKCDIGYIANSDRVRSDGYRPTYYRCRNMAQGKKDWRECDGYTSDVTLGPFILRYLANLVLAEALIRKNPRVSPSKLQQCLLQGLADITGIQAEDLVATVEAIMAAAGIVLDKQPVQPTINLDQERMKQSMQKHERALDRLEQAYLYDDTGISEKEFIKKRQAITIQIEDMKKQLAATAEETAPREVDFIQKASSFLLVKKILSGEQDFIDLIKGADKPTLQHFMNDVLERIVVNEKRVISIQFRGGITHRFTYLSI